MEQYTSLDVQLIQDDGGVTSWSTSYVAIIVAQPQLKVVRCSVEWPVEPRLSCGVTAGLQRSTLLPVPQRVISVVEVTLSGVHQHPWLTEPVVAKEIWQQGIYGVVYRARAAPPIVLKEISDSIIGRYKCPHMLAMQPTGDAHSINVSVVNFIVNVAKGVDPTGTTKLVGVHPTVHLSVGVRWLKE